jgi:hypothetical protein
MITVPLCQPGSPKYIITMLRFRGGKINIDSEKYLTWIVANGVTGHIYNDVEVRFESEIDAVAFRLKFGL